MEKHFNLEFYHSLNLYVKFQEIVVTWTWKQASIRKIKKKGKDQSYLFLESQETD